VNAYKCVDASGAIYFSDQQCRGSQQQTVIEIKPSPAASTAEIAAIKARHERQQQMLDAAAQDRSNLRRQRAAEQARRKAEAAAICDAQMSLLDKLQGVFCPPDQRCTFYGMTKIDADGNSVIASEQEKKTEIHRLEDNIAKNCQALPLMKFRHMSRYVESALAGLRASAARRRRLRLIKWGLVSREPHQDQPVRYA